MVLYRIYDNRDSYTRCELVQRFLLLLYAIEAGFILFVVGLYFTIIIIPCALLVYGCGGIYNLAKSLYDRYENVKRARE